MMKIGIFGGTFNPVHNGHINLAGCYKEALGLDKIIFIPTATPPHKMAKNLASDLDRTAMLTLALRGIKGFELSGMELERRGKSYTYETLAAYKKEHPSDEVFLIVGSDMFLSFHEWYRYEDMLKMATLCTAARSETDSLTEMRDYADKVLGLKEQNYVISRFPVVLAASTAIRDNLMNGRPISGLVPEAVERYIYERGVYFETPEAHFKALVGYRLSEKRAYHSLCVADSAKALAERYGADPALAYRAGLLHDIMREENPMRQLQVLAQAGIIITPLEKNAVSLYHAMSGAVYCRDRLGVKDEALLNAVRYHTTGRAGMTLLEKIVFVADIISADRNYPDVNVTRRKAEASINEALLYGLEFTVNHLTSMGVPVHPDTLAAYEFAKSEAVYERT